MSNFAVQRKNMVEGQVRTSDVTDRRIIRAMLEIPRELFVPADVRPLAYIDRDLRVTPMGESRVPRYLLAPSVHARMLQALDLNQQEVVLDVACATGYGSALLSRIAQTVVALEVDAGLADAAARTLGNLGVDNVVVVVGPHQEGWPAEGPYDAIIVNGAVTDAPAGLLGQLKDGGRLVAVRLREGAPGRATIWRRSGDHFAFRELFDAAAKVVPGFEPKREFVF
jgi:protein-L-isoaspartate(D-aspartate) O-methyltransferase